MAASPEGVTTNSNMTAAGKTIVEAIFFLQNMTQPPKHDRVKEQSILQISYTMRRTDVVLSLDINILALTSKGSLPGKESEAPNPGPEYLELKPMEPEQKKRLQRPYNHQGVRIEQARAFMKKSKLEILNGFSNPSFASYGTVPPISSDRIK